MKIKDITPSNARNFIQGNALMALSKVKAAPQHVVEQAVYRAYLCKECLYNGRCGCGCKAPHLFFAPKKKDHLGRWGRMMSREEWEEFKKTEEYINIANNPEYKEVVKKITNEA